MTFNSLTYLLFLAIVAPIVAIGPDRARRVAILLGSLVFYGFWRVDFLLLLLFNTTVDYWLARAINATQSQRSRRIMLVIDVCFNLGMLAWFKYSHLFVQTTLTGLGLLGIDIANPLPDITLPIGISFYVFLTMSYTIDVYQRREKPITSFPLFMSYVVFWPHLVAGPILRVSDVVPQIVDRRRPDYREVMKGIEEILCGLFKKTVLADAIAPIVDAGFSKSAGELGMLDAWTLAFAFGFQIYFDFSGYSQIAIGSARVMGIRFPENFNWPYLAVSPRDFWKRWHITLSSWIRDYLYLPLQGLRPRGASSGGIEADADKTVGSRRRTFALIVTWALMGLWHGANWTFVAWGIWHASFILLYRVTRPLRETLPSAVRSYGGWVFTLGYAMLAWLFFRAATLGQAVDMLRLAFDVRRVGTLGLREMNYLIVFLYFVGFLLVAGVGVAAKRWQFPAYVRLATIAVGYTTMFFWTILLLRPVRQFIYFQF